MCRAISPELAAERISLKDLEAARTARRRALRAKLDKRRSRTDQLVPRAPYAQRSQPPVEPAGPPKVKPRPARSRLALYREK